MATDATNFSKTLEHNCADAQLAKDNQAVTQVILKYIASQSRKETVRVTHKPVISWHLCDVER